jgi:hypothetical protein
LARANAELTPSAAAQEGQTHFEDLGRVVTMAEEQKTQEAYETQEPQPTRTRATRRWHLVPFGKGQPCEKQVEQAVPVDDTLVMEKYQDYPLVLSMLSAESIRDQTLRKDGHKQIDCVKSNDGWVRTTFVVEGRALDNILLPWILVTINATIWTCFVELHRQDWLTSNTDQWEFFIGIVSIHHCRFSWCFN